MREFTIPRLQRKKNAYTLIEILVSLTIIGIIFSFGYVSYRDFSRRQEVANTAKMIQGDLRFAQASATTGQKPSGCNSTLEGYSFDVTPPSEYTIDANCGASDITVKDVDLPSDISFSNSAPIPTLQFKVLGQGNNVGPGGWSVTLLQTGTSNNVTVTVTSGGQIQ